MTELGDWLKAKIQDRGLTYNAAAVYSGVGQATISDIINKGHVPRVETLHRLADYFGVSRAEVMRLAGHLDPIEPGDNHADAVLQARFNELLRRWRLVDRYAPDQLEKLINIAYTQAELVLGAAKAAERLEEKEDRENRT